MKATALAVAFAITTCLSATVAFAADDNDDHFFNYGTSLGKSARITQADADLADGKFRLRYALQEPADEMDDIATSEEFERMLKTLNPEEREIALRIYGITDPAN